MMQDMEYIETSCVVNVKVGTLNRLEQMKISVLTVTTLEILMLTLQH